MREADLDYLRGLGYTGSAGDMLNDFLETELQYTDTTTQMLNEYLIAGGYSGAYTDMLDEFLESTITYNLSTLPTSISILETMKNNISVVPDTWILVTGNWEDSGMWKDTSTWNDGV